MAKHTDDQTEKMRRLLDAQAQELELRFNQFLKELENDFNYAPSFDSDKDSDDNYVSISKIRASRLDERLTNIEKRYADVDRKYTIMMWITGLMTAGVFIYLGYVLFNQLT
jgi:hypothetical protein